MRAVVLGGVIAGLSAAHALLAEGLEVGVADQWIVASGRAAIRASTSSRARKVSLR
jgi:predicted NAD/FAD-dependent oxidoreductase